MTDPLPGFYCDGASLRSVPVSVELEAEELRFRGEGLERAVPLREIKASSRLGHLPRFLRLPDGAMLELPDSDRLENALAEVQPQRMRLSPIHWLESRAPVAAASTILIAAAVVVVIWIGLPVLARRAARLVPVEVETKIGETSTAIFMRGTAPSTLGDDEQSFVRAQLARLTAVRKTHVPLRIIFRPMGFPNAFALPNGTIIVTDELVQLAEGSAGPPFDDLGKRAAAGDEIAGILAHEMGHIELRHGVQSLLRNSTALLVVSILTGDLSTLTTFSGLLPTLLVQRGYAREFEQQADDYAVVLLRAARINPGHLADVLDRLEKSRPAAGPDFSYLSTHPSTAGRMESIRSKSGPEAPAFDREEAGAADPADAQIFYNRGSAKERTGDHDGAIADFDRAIRLDPDDSDPYNDRGTAKFWKNDLPAAMADYSRAIELKPDYAPAFRNRGRVKIAVQDFPGAIADETRAAEIKPDYADAYRERAHAKTAAGDAAGAAADWRKAADLEPRDYGTWISLGDADYKMAAYRDAESDYTHAIAINPTNSSVIRNRALARLALKDADGTISDDSLAIKLKPDYFDAYNDRGRGELMNRDPISAQADFEMAMKLDPKSPYPHHNRALIKLDRRDYDGTIADETEAIRLMPEYSLAYRERGAAEYFKNDPDTAIADLDAADRIKGDDSRTHYLRGLARNRKGDTPGAISDFDAAIAVDPKNKDIYAARAEARRLGKDFDGALTDIDEAIQDTPAASAFGLYLERCRVKRDAGNFDGAIADCNLVLKLRPNLAAAFKDRGACEMGQADWPRAIADFGRAIEGDSGAARARDYRARGDAEFAANEPEAAMTDYDSYIRLGGSEAIYGRFFISLICRRLHREDSGADLTPGIEEVKDSWSKTVARYLSGALAEPEFLDLAEHSAAHDVSGHQCEAFYYAGMIHLLDNDVLSARVLLAKCLVTRETSYSEFILAKAELSRMGPAFPSSQ